MSGIARCGEWLCAKFRRDTSVSGVRTAAARWKKQGLPLDMALALCRDALRGMHVTPRIGDDTIEWIVA